MTGTESARQEVQRRASRSGELYTAGDLGGLAAVYSEDGRAMPPGGSTVQGRPAMQQFWQGVHDSGVEAISTEPLEVEVAGELAYEIGRGILTVRGGAGPDSGTSEVVVRYVIVWRRQGGGWQIAIDIWNSETAG